MIRSSRFLFMIALFTTNLFFTESACQSCLWPALHHHRPRSQWNSAIAATLPQQRAAMITTVSSIAALKNLQVPLVRKSIAVAIISVIAVNFFRMSSEDADSEPAVNDSETKTSKPPITSAMVATIGIYKNFISPLLPPACRFLPTCSQYGVQAIEEFGPTKGAILTAWRLLRCSPFGGRGYDPPQWPPVKYTYGSY